MDQSNHSPFGLTISILRHRRCVKREGNVVIPVLEENSVCGASLKCRALEAGTSWGQAGLGIENRRMEISRGGMGPF
jgi:hypothetical protein